MKAKDLTTRHRIMILEDVLKKLESGDTGGGLCVKIKNSALNYFEFWIPQTKLSPFSRSKMREKLRM